METIQLEITILKPLETTWNAYTDTEEIKKWFRPTDDWECSKAEHDFRVDGHFLYQIEHKDDYTREFEGIFTEIEPQRKISLRLTDGREAVTTMRQADPSTTVINTEFQPDPRNMRSMEYDTWYGLLYHLQKYLEEK